MKTLAPHFKPSLLTIALLCTPLLLTGQTDGINKKFHYDAQVNSDSRLTIENKYGDVTVNNWDQNKLVIDVIVTMRVKDQDRAEKLLSYITVNYSQEGNEIKAITQIDDKFNNPGNFFSMGDDKNFSIDYTVNMPADLDFTLRNKYGNVAISELTGHADIAVKYGNLKANKILRNDNKPLSQVSLGYSHGSSIEEVNWIKLDLKYSKLEISKARAVVAVSKYSKVRIEEASSLVCEAKYDEYSVGRLVNFVGSAGYTDLSFDQVSRKFDLSLKYGKCNLNYVPAAFESIRVESSYADVALGFDPKATFNFQGDASYADINYPRDNARVNRIEENTSLHVDGIIGKANTSSSEVNVKTSYGNVSIRRNE
ncbi:MAG: hypothetical protein U0T82_14140 [Bacteroidales bacterium]